MIRSNVVFPEPLSPRMVRNSPSANYSDTSRKTTLRPNALAMLRMLSSIDFWVGIVLTGGLYCAAFTSFQISVYFVRRGTFCQK